MYDENAGLYYDKGKIVNLSFLPSLYFEILVNNKGKVVTYHQILKEIYNDNGIVTANKRAKINITMNRLISQLEGFVKIGHKRHIGFYIIGVE